MKTSISGEIARILLQTQAVKLNPQNPFRWSSGWNSPIYCDNRVTLSFPQERTFIKNALCALIKEQFPKCDAIAGVATAGIAQGALIADAMHLPFLYVRPEPKKHGMQNTIEGRFTPGQQIVLIEDLISTGGSSIKAANNLKEAGASVLGIAATVTYGFPTATQNFADAGIALACLSDYSAIITEALAMNYISKDQVDLLETWRQNPAEWGK